MTSRRPRILLALHAALLATLASVAATPALAADAPRAAKAPWELEVESEAAEQTGQIDRARPRKAMAGVVNVYASRLARSRSPLNHFLYGRALYYNEDPVGARAQMQLALEADPAFYPARVRLALLLLDLKNYADAEKQLTQVIAVRPDLPEALELSLRSAVEQKDWDRAVGLLTRRIDREPSAARWRALLGQVHMQRRDWEAARREWSFLRQRDPASTEYRFFHAVSRVEAGEVDAGIADLEALSKEDPGRLDVLDRLRSAYALKKDREKVRATLERMVPHLTEEGKKEALAMIERLRRGPEAAGEPTTATVSWTQVMATATDDPDKDRRARALRALHEGCQMGYLKEVPAIVIRRVSSDVEPDAACRAWVVRILGQLSPQVLPVVSLALYDEDATVRTIASEVLGEMGQPAAVLYLLPFTETEGLDLVEYESVRAALARLTDSFDLPPGCSAVASRDDLQASREAWRRWRLSDESVPVKLAAIRQLGEVGETSPERFLYDLVQDPTFEVMRAAYLAMRTAVSRPPRDPVERKVFPKFPSVPDADVTRASMKTIQDRVKSWWGEWVAERRAFIRAKGPGGR
ncbi:MAG TPA: tetratricopeptide repeat protein [Planctomycetota bacterium]|nr:tetratricopeptide repeat protein [Planctomycetota bacterium]